MIPICPSYLVPIFEIQNGSLIFEVVVLLNFCWTPATRKMQRRIVKSESPIVEDSFQRKQMTRRSHAAFTWVFVNVILAATFLTELWVAHRSKLDHYSWFKCAMSAVFKLLNLAALLRLFKKKWMRFKAILRVIQLCTCTSDICTAN